MDVPPKLNIILKRNTNMYFSLTLISNKNNGFYDFNV